MRVTQCSTFRHGRCFNSRSTSTLNQAETDDGGDVALRIGLVSDTHIPEARASLWPQVYDAFHGVDYIFHGGDVHELDLRARR